MPGIPTTLDQYGAARDTFFAALVDRLKNEPSVDAAWLTGAHGRGEDDLWSDFDLQVAVNDATIEAALAQPHTLFRLGGAPILVQAGFPSDSIPEGKFWLVIYPGPFMVDWNIGPSSAAVRPEVSQLLFAKVPVTVTRGAPALEADALRARAQSTLEFFWAMAPIAAKYAGRGWTERAILQLDLLRTGYIVLWRLANGRSRASEPYDQNRKLDAEIDGSLPRLGTSATPLSAVRAVREYCALVMGLSDSLQRLGAAVDPDLHREIEVLIQMAERNAGRGGSSPDHGSRR